MKKMGKCLGKCVVLLPIFLFSRCAVFARNDRLVPDAHGFVSIEEVDPSIIVEMRYFGSHNFIGHRIAGYLAPKCLLTVEAATALAQVQADLKPFGLSLKMYDCYRPQTAVNEFISWAEESKDTKMKGEFYPQVEKREVFKLGYIAKKSGHSRGSTVDLTLVSVPPPIQPFFSDGEPLVPCTGAVGKRFADNSLDMGTGYDCMDPLAATANPMVAKPANIHRALLKTVMERRGFQNYEAEWWHFTLKDEPNPNTGFDFPVQ